MKTVRSIIINLIVYVAIVAGIVWGFPRYLVWQMGTPYPMAAITSGSMWPALHTGDFILIKAVRPQDIRVGDIVVWKNEKGFTIHRVSQLNQETLVTKGDANFTEDAPVRYEDVVGRMVTIGSWPVRIPYVGYISVMRG